MRGWVTIVMLAVLCGCGGTSTQNQADAAPQQDAPVVQTDATSDGSGGDGGGATLRAHAGSAVMSGAVQASSPRYRVIMSTGQSPGGNGTASSANNKLRGGLVGATQGK